MNKIVNIVLGFQLTLDKSELDDDTLSHIRSFLTMDNPKYIDAQKHDRYIGDLDQYIHAFDEDKDYIRCLRGFLGSFFDLLLKHGYKYCLIDNRRKLDDIELVFGGNLRGYQQRAVTASLKKYFGILVAPCGSGKTVMACAIMAERKQPTLVIVHTKELLNQWIKRIGQYLGIPSNYVGIIGSGKENIKPITVGMVQTLRKRNLYEIREHFGQIIVDEAQHCPSSTFTDVVSAFDSYYMLGLSATPYRRDKLNKLIFTSLGNIAAQVHDSELQEAGLKIKPLIITRETGFDFDYLNDSKGKLSDEQHIVLYHLLENLKDVNLSADAIKNINSKINAIIYQPMISALIEDADRNQLIADDIANEARFGNSILVLSDRKLHLANLDILLKEKNLECRILTADVPKKQREEIIHDFESGALRVVLATGQLAGEGLDIPRINRLFIVSPVKWKGRIIQYVGRALRPIDGKYDTKIYDYVDLPVILKSSYWARMREYKKLGGIRC